MEQTTKTYPVTIKKLSGSRIELTVALPSSVFDATRSEAIRHIGRDVALPGFRKGHVPEKVLLAKIGESALLEEMAEITIGRVYPTIIVEEKLDVLGRPEVKITKIAHGNPLEFTVTTAVFPEVKLPDYKKLAAKAAKKHDGHVKVTEADIDKTIAEIRKMRGQQEAEMSGTEFSPDAPLPEIDDAYVATLGAFKTVAELRDKLRENITKDKEREAKDKKRVAIMEAIADDTKIELPDVIVEQELNRMQDEFAADVSRMGLDFDGYLSAVKKDKEELRKEWRPDAEKRAKIQIIVGKIADEEKIEPNKEKLEQETSMLTARYPDTDKERIHSYVHMLLTNDAVFEFLENQA